MGLHLKVVNHDEVFHSLREPPIIVNEVDVLSTDAKTRFNEMISTKYGGDSLSVVPSCDCGEVLGEYNIGKMCQGCHTKVQHSTERHIESGAWIEVPEGVKGLINPVFWLMFSSYFKASSCNMVEWLCNPAYKNDNPNNALLNRLKAYGFPRGLNNFHNNFDAIMEALFKIFNINRNTSLQHLKTMIEMHRDAVFCRYLPIPSKICFITEKTVTGTFADPTMALALDAIRTISMIKTLRTMTLKRRELRALKCCMQLAEYYDETFKSGLASKEGWFRKHTFGGRLHFTFRAVITSLSDNHDYDEIHLPWSLSVGAFKTMLTNKLLNLDYTPKGAAALLQEHTNKYHPLIDDLFKELIAESPRVKDVIPDAPVKDDTHGILIILQRNPTLARGSAQALRVTKIKTDVEVKTISMSVNILAAPNKQSIKVK